MGSDGYRLAAEVCPGWGEVILEVGSGKSTEFLVGVGPTVTIDLHLDYPGLRSLHPLTALLGRAEELLTHWHEPSVGNGAPVGFAWLDGHDWPYDDLPPDMLARQTDEYLSAGLELSKPASRASHLRIAQLVAPWVPPGGVIAFDDTWRTAGGFEGKGGTAVPWLLAARNREGPLFELWRVQDDTEPWRHNSYVAVRRRR